jgi:hypothetical protein
MQDITTTVENHTTALRELTTDELHAVTGGVVPPRHGINLCDHGGPLCGGPSLSGVLFGVAGAIIGGVEGFIVSIL